MDKENTQYQREINALKAGTTASIITYGILEKNRYIMYGGMIGGILINFNVFIDILSNSGVELLVGAGKGFKKGAEGVVGEGGFISQIFAGVKSLYT